MDLDLALVRLGFLEPVVTLSAELAVLFLHLLSILCSFDSGCASEPRYRCSVLAFAV
jgi:hypothetical protein